MASVSLTTSRRALVIFIILALAFLIQMLWWIIFQTRSTSETKTALSTALVEEQAFAVALLNSQYQSLYRCIKDGLKQDFSIRVIEDYRISPLISGIAGDQSVSYANLDDSMYFNFSANGGQIYVFLDRGYPAGILSENGRLHYRPPSPQQLVSSGWLTEEHVVIDSASLLQIDRKEYRHRRMLIGEGSFFLLLIIVGAWLIYSAMKRARRLEQEHILFVRSITHELKIPISSINLFLDTMKRRGFDSALSSELVPKMKEDLTRLNTLIDNLLRVKSLWEGKPESEPVPVDLSEQLKRFAKTVSGRINEVAGRLELRLEQAATISANLPDLMRVWEIIIDNSLKYARCPSLQITVSLRRIKDTVELRFSDNGPGIIPGTEEKIFEQFHRGNVSEEKSIPGSGLGLYIAREFVRRNSGTIMMQNNESGGCTVVMRFKAEK
ncbi:MAG: HAMP domain-containing histidine kinase [Candidatus Zixiibacteriota bacterium]|nr:MAG: HAMP domain-containing histidine kinase [candidate division Zixibacteria bacterium]